MRPPPRRASARQKIEYRKCPSALLITAEHAAGKVKRRPASTAGVFGWTRWSIADWAARPADTATAQQEHGMFEKLKGLMNPNAPAGAAEHIEKITKRERSSLAVELRFLLRNGLRAEDYPYLMQLGQTAAANYRRIHIPATAVPRLALEIGAIRDRLPPKSPLLGLAESLEKCRGKDLLLLIGDQSATAGAPAPETGQAVRRADTTPATTPDGDDMRLFKPTAADAEASYVSTGELAEPAQAAYYRYCLAQGEYDKIIADLRPLAASEPRVWIWNLLVAAMRRSDHADFKTIVAQFHDWLELQHPGTLNDTTVSDDRRKFNGERIAAIEKRELERTRDEDLDSRFRTVPGFPLSRE
jgi:hypothetical protein